MSIPSLVGPRPDKTRWGQVDRDRGVGSPDGREWKRMWKLVPECNGADTRCKVPGCRCAENPHDGEVWQYMGSFSDPMYADGAWIHTFRHRSFPVRDTSIDADHVFTFDSVVGVRVNAQVFAAPGWTPTV